MSSALQISCENVFPLIKAHTHPSPVNAGLFMSKKSNALIFVLCAGALSSGPAVANWTDADVATTRMEAKTFTSTGAHPAKVEYLLYLPKAYQASPTARWPLMLYLHG